MHRLESLLFGAVQGLIFAFLTALVLISAMDWDRMDRKLVWRNLWDLVLTALALSVLMGGLLGYCLS